MKNILIIIAILFSVNLQAQFAVGELINAGLKQQGTVTSNTDLGQGIYNLDASSGAFTFILPPTTGTQNRYRMIGSNVETNNVTIGVQAGEFLNKVLNGTDVFDTNGTIIEYIDGGVGSWFVEQSQTTVDSYMASFTTGDFVSNQLTITQATHGLPFSAGTIYEVIVTDSNGDVTNVPVNINQTNGTVTLNAAGFNGIILIK